VPIWEREERERQQFLGQVPAHLRGVDAVMLTDAGRSPCSCASGGYARRCWRSCSPCIGS
jgi:hypothetical protein